MVRYVFVQSHPLDCNTDEFYENRKEAIEKRLNEISQWECDGFSAPEMIRDTWEANKDVNCVGMNWDRFSSAQQAVVGVLNLMIFTDL